ncbi:hypothetical protein FVEN_g12643 [Fusarium venenatum]|nr:hypothetical protein FVEN_g12643 [Fusarium venenatum]
MTTSAEATTTIDTPTATTSAGPLSCEQLNNPYTVDSVTFTLECGTGTFGGAGIANVQTDDFASCIKACADITSCITALRKPSSGICSLLSSSVETGADSDADSFFKEQGVTTSIATETSN